MIDFFRCSSFLTQVWKLITLPLMLLESASRKKSSGQVNDRPENFSIDQIRSRCIEIFVKTPALSKGIRLLWGSRISCSDRSLNSLSSLKKLPTIPFWLSRALAGCRWWTYSSSRIWSGAAWARYVSANAPRTTSSVLGLEIIVLLICGRHVGRR